MDLLGRKVYLAGALQLRVANQQALFSRYNYNTWAEVGRFTELLPQDSRQEFTAFLEEGKKMARTSLQALLDAADSAARTLASGIAMRRISWLQVSNLPPELQYTIQDLPFDETGRTLTGGMAKVGIDANQDPKGAKIKVPRNHQRDQNLTFEGAPKDGKPLISQDPSPPFSNCLSYFLPLEVTTALDLCLLFQITVLTSQPGKYMVKQLETGLREIDLVSLRKLQIIEISQGDLLESVDVEWHIHAEEEVSSDDSVILGMDIDLQTIQNDVVSLETFFKTWLHDHGTDREQLHILLPSGDFRHFTAPRTSLTCVKCDIQERLLSPALLPGAADVTVRTDDVNTPYQMAASPATTLYKLRVIKALKAEGVCESALFGLPFIIKPTSCWQLDWDELEMNQHNFHALCHSLLKRDWMLLAKREPQSESPSWSITVNSYYVIIPSDSFTLLVKDIAVRELLLPCNVPALSADLPETALSTIESALNSLEVEPRYNPLDVKSNLYKYLVSEFSRPQYRQQAQPKEHRPGERHHSRQHLSKAKAMVAPLPLARPPLKAFRSSAARKDACELPLFSDEDSEFLGSM
ncbi:meiosis 1 arrest protein [Pangshura tecta]